MCALSTADNLAAVRDRMAAACARAGRPEDEVRLVAISKRIELRKVVDAVKAGQLDFGENRIPDAIDRQPQLARLLEAEGLDPDAVRWHFVGHLQRNKATKAAGAFTLLHALHGADLVRRLHRSLEGADRRPQSVLIQVKLSGEEQKQGIDAEELPELIDVIGELPRLDLRGLMTMARFGASQGELHRTFATLRRLRDDVRSASGLSLPELSMGMSGDFEAAIAEGATLVRVGTAIFGERA